VTEHRRWFASYPEDVPKTLVPYPEVSAFSMLQGAAERHPDKPAIAWFGRHISYLRLRQETERFAAVLAGLGVDKGARVGLVLPNCPEYVIAYYAALRLGAIVVGNNPLYTQRELEHQLKDAGCDVVVVLEQLYPNVEAVRGDVGIRDVIVTKLNHYMKFPLNLLAPFKFRKDARHEGKPWPPVPKGAPVKWWGDLMKAAGPTPPPAVIDPKTDPAGFIYTGGTTGLSKGAMLSHFNIVANAMQSAAWFPDLKDGEDALMCVLPFFHSYGMTVEMNLSVFRAAKMILVPRFELHMVLREIQREKPTLFPGVPRLYIGLNEAPESRKYDLRSIKACLSGAAPLPAAVADKFEALTGARLLYGFHQIGGTRYDLPAGWAETCRETVAHIERRIEEYEAVLEGNTVFLVRTQGVGVISPELAQEVGVSGPLLRGSGIAHDIRRAEPYSAYEDFAFDVPVETAGDCHARYRVRMQEFRQAIRIVRQVLDGLPEGPISSRPGVKSVGQVKLPKGEAYARVEGPRGEVGIYLVSDGTTKPYRMKWRGASFSNLAVAGHILPGHKVADAVAILGSIDPVFGEVDR